MSEMIKIPNGWNKFEIQQCCEILDNQRVPLSDAIRQTKKGNIPYYGANGIVDYIDDYIFDEDLILLAEDGGDFVNYKAKPIAYKISGKSWVNNHAHIIKAKNEFYQNFIFYGLEHKDILYYINGGTRSKLNKSDLMGIELLIPKQEKEQQKIAEVLSEIDNAISKTEELFEKNKRLKTALMQDLLRYGIDESGKIRNPQTHKFKPSELGDIPEEWTTEKLGNTKNFTLKTGGTPSTTKKEYWDNGNILWMSSGEVNNKVITDTELKITELGYKSSNATLLPKFSILMALAGQGKTRGTVAINHVELSTNQSVAAITCNNKIVSSQFLFYYLDSQYENLRNISYGAGRAGLSLTILREIDIIFPPITEQQKIAQILSSQDEKIEDVKNKLNKLKSLKASLMQDLLSGKKRVTKLMESN